MKINEVIFIVFNSFFANVFFRKDNLASTILAQPSLLSIFDTCSHENINSKLGTTFEPAIGASAYSANIALTTSLRIFLHFFPASSFLCLLLFISFLLNCIPCLLGAKDHLLTQSVALVLLILELILNLKSHLGLWLSKEFRLMFLLHSKIMRRKRD